jgi:hypothetical protein
MVHASRCPVTGSLVDVAGTATNMIAAGSMTISLTDNFLNRTAALLEAGKEFNKLVRMFRIDAD